MLVVIGMAQAIGVRMVLMRGMVLLGHHLGLMVVCKPARQPHHRRHALDRERQDAQPNEEGLEKLHHSKLDYCSAPQLAQRGYLAGSASGFSDSCGQVPSTSDNSANRRASDEALGFSRNTHRLPVRLQ